jgi:uncharacterized membrane protein
MFASWSKWIALALVVAAAAAPTAVAESPLAAKTEAAGFTAITHYLVAHAAQPDIADLAAKTEAKGFLALQPKAVDVARLGAQTEAKGYRALVRYQEQRAASPVMVSSPSRGFDWGDALIGSGMTIGVFLLGAAAAITARRRHGLARLRS